MKQAWFRLSCSYWRDPKFHGLGIGHEVLWTRLLGYTVEHSTDGLIPAHAVSLCGRGIRHRERVLAGLVLAGLLEATQDPLVHPYCFPSAWARYQQRTPSAHISPGQGGSSRAGGQEESRGSIYNKKPQVQQAPAKLIDGETYRFLAGSGWVKDHGANQDAEEGSQN